MNLALGDYATEVLLSYGGGVLMLGVIVWLTVAQYNRAARALDRAEQGAAGKGQGDG